MSTSPTVTVLVTVYNGANYVAQAISSILNQTMPNFELLVIDDASTDKSRDVIAGFSDPRIRLIKQTSNRGIQSTLNRGLREAKAPLMAIMDQDDISAPQRLAAQIAQFRTNPQLAVCGTAIDVFGETPGPSWIHYFDPTNLQIALLFENPICHPSVMMDRATLLQLGLNYPDFPLAEEYALWVRSSRVRQITNLPQKLLRYRAHSQQVSRSRNLLQTASIDLVLSEQLHQLRLGFNSRDLMVHKLLSGGFSPIPGIQSKMSEWTERLLRANSTETVYDQSSFARQLNERKAAALASHRQRLQSMSFAKQLRWRTFVLLDYLKTSTSPL